jgi:hypothetical protein
MTSGRGLGPADVSPDVQSRLWSFPSVSRSPEQCVVIRVGLLMLQECQTCSVCSGWRPSRHVGVSGLFPAPERPLTDEHRP